MLPPSAAFMPAPLSSRPLAVTPSCGQPCYRWELLDDWIDVVMDWIGLDVLHILVVWIGYVPHFIWTHFSWIHASGSIHGIHVCVLLAQVRVCLPLDDILLVFILSMLLCLPFFLFILVLSCI